MGELLRLLGPEGTAATVGLVVGVLMLAVLKARRTGWTSALIAAVTACAIAAVAGWVVWWMLAIASI